jgi:hypothetical protein
VKFLSNFFYFEIIFNCILNNLNLQQPTRTKNAKEESDISENESNTRKSTRLSKKPRILEEYLVSPTSATVETTNGFYSSDRAQQQQKQTDFVDVGAQKLHKKLTARKSTAFNINSQENRLSLNATNLGLSQQQQQQTIKLALTNNFTHNNKSITNNAAILASSTPTVNRTTNSSINLINSKTLSTTIPTNTSTCTTQTQTTTITTATTSVNINGKQIRHKQINCKPLCESKATECMPFMRDASTQLDLDEIKLTHTVVPVPVPINIPVPMCMYQAPMPIPLLLPIPIPVPVFIPTTKRTYERVERRIKVSFFIY